MKSSNRTYNILLLLCGICFLISFFPQQEESLDIHLHDTYFIIAYRHIYWIYSFFIFFIWLMYFLLNRLLYSKVLTTIHILSIVLWFLTNLTLHFVKFGISETQAGAPKTYNDFSSFESFNSMLEIYGSQTKYLILFSIFLFIAQIVFPINILLGLIARIVIKNSS